MPTYVLLSTLTPEKRRSLQKDPDRSTGLACQARQQASGPLDSFITPNRKRPITPQMFWIAGCLAARILNFLPTPATGSEIAAGLNGIVRAAFWHKLHADPVSILTRKPKGDSLCKTIEKRQSRS